MKTQKRIIIAALLGFALAACHKNPAETGAAPTPGPQAPEAAPGAAPAPAATPAPSVESQMRQAYGFAAQMPADTASYTAFYKLGKLWGDITQSKTWAAIKSNPIVVKALSDESFRQAASQITGSPESAKWKAILKDALGNETFIAFAQGSEAKFHAWVKLNDDIRSARLQALVTGGIQAMSNPKFYASVILPEVKDLHFPPMIIGFKITSQKAALDEQLAQAEKNLPPFVESGSFTLDGNHPFKSVAMTVDKALKAMAPNEEESLKSTISETITDPQAADALYQSILGRRIEIAYGYVGEYFIVSIGPDHSQLKFAANYADSLIARPELQKAADYTGKPVVSLSWASQEMMAACQQDFKLMSSFDELKQNLSETLSPSDMERMETDLKRIDAEGKGVFNRDVTSMVGVEYRDHGLRGEVYGGLSGNPAATAMKFSQVPADSTFVWVDRMANPALNEAARIWFEDLVSTGYDTFLRIGLPRVPMGEQAVFGMIQGKVVPKIEEFYQITRDQFAKSLGPETAFAMDLNGEVPNIPDFPPELHGGKTMRLAILNNLQDRALLAQSWDGYFKLANEIAQMSPAGTILYPNGLPKPQNENVNGVALWYYKLPAPMDAGDLLPNVAVTDKTFVAGTSRAYSLELSKAAAQPGAEKQMTLDVRVNFKPAFDFADTWLKLSVKYPELFFNGDEDKEADFKKSEPDIEALVNALRPLGGLSVQEFEENGVHRISTDIPWNEK